MDVSGTTILRLGDIILDRFAYCGIDRISPEAPVPVLLRRRVETMLGGAGNVARNIAALESVDAVTSFGDDTPLELIRRLKPDVLMKGADYTVATVVGAEGVVAAGGRVSLLDLVDGHSTTQVIGRPRAPARG